MPTPFEIHEDITRAQTPPAAFYADPAYYDLAKRRIFRRAWQFIAGAEAVKIPGQCTPHDLLAGSIDEPILLTRDRDDNVHCLSNVCTHRGTILCEHAGVEKSLICRYHGRRFDLDGAFRHMPEFDDVVGFPSPDDNLARVPFGTWGGAGSNDPAGHDGALLFAAIDPAVPLEEQLAPLTDRLAWLPMHEFRFDASRSRDYLVQANWALYVDNYLEGFHIPFVHASLNQTIDYAQYTVEIFPYCNLQLGMAQPGEDKPGETTFDLPASSPDHGKPVAAYYWWLFPNTMLNFYPWGLSINVVLPLAHDRTRVRFLTYIWDESKLERGAGASLDRVEREDEAVVEAEQRGMRGSFYSRGRYAPKREQAVHHFHRLLARYLFAEPVLPE